MIFQTQPSVSWPFFFGILVLLAIIGSVPLFLQWRKENAPARLGFRALFFVGFIVCLSMAILRPVRVLESRKELTLIYQDNLEKAVVDFWKDSLEIKKTTTLSKYRPNSNPIILLGEKFSKTELYPLRNLEFQWILREKHGAVSELAWKGYLRKGEIQRLSYRVFSEKSEEKLAMSGTDLENIQLKKGWNSGLLEFAPTGLGKANFPLLLGQDTLASLRFYIGAALPKKYHFKFGFPTAESRTLSEWLRDKGETVSEEIKLSRETVMQSGTSQDSLQVLLIDPAQLDQKSVQDGVKTGKTALLVMNVGQAAETAQKINHLFGTDFQVEQTGQNEDRILENGVAALPFVFQEKPGQKLLQDRSVAIQYAGSNPVAMSLVSASFPLNRQGKTEIYESVWGGLFGLLEPDEINSWRINAPLISEISEEIQVFRKDSLPQELSWQEDTLSTRKSAVNPYLASAQLLVSKSGWVNLDSGFSVFVYGADELPSLQTAALIQEFKANAIQRTADKLIPKEPISLWIWLVGMSLFLGLMWVEPKVDY